MGTMMKTRNAWWRLTAGLLALTFGYTVFLVERGTVFAGAAKCPASGGACAHGECLKHDSCTNGKCGPGCAADCPLKHSNV